MLSVAQSLNQQLLEQAIERILQGRTGCMVRIHVSKNQGKGIAGRSVTEKTETESEED